MSTKISQKNISTEWRVTQMTDIVTSIASGKSDTKNESGIFPIYGSTGIIGYKEKSDYSGNKILIARVGANAGTVNLVSGDYCVSDNTLMVSYKSGVNIDFQYYYLIKNDLHRLVFGSGQPLITAGHLKKLTLLLPPFPEQKRIVLVLEAWDLAIEKLKRKIKVKKEIKKGLMQKLLTGEIRLAGFTGNWSIHNLGELGKIISGGTPETSDPSYWGDDYIWVTPTEITKLKSRYISDSDKGISNLGLKNSSATLVPPQSLILCSRATIAECAINTVEVTTNQGFKNFVPKKIDIYFLYYWVKLNKKAFLRISAGSTFLEFGKGDMEKLRITIPDMKEQQEISEILTKADDEIERLQQKLTIIKDQKKYLLNNLITGTIRTPESLSIPK